MFGVCIRSSWKLRPRTRLHSFSSAAQGETKNLVSIPASEVAAAIGKNEYKPSSELLEVLWKRFSPNTFTGITKIEEEQEAFAKMPLDAQRALTEALKVPAQNATDVQRTISSASEVVLQNQNLSDADKSKVLEMMKRNVSTRFGLANEDRVVRTVAAREKVKFTRETAVLVIPLCDIGDTRYVVRGKIDRLQEEGDEMILVEVTLTRTRTRTRILTKPIGKVESQGAV